MLYTFKGALGLLLFGKFHVAHTVLCTMINEEPEHNNPFIVRRYLRAEYKYS